MRRNYTLKIWLIFIFMVIVFTIIKPVFISPRNLIHLLTQISFKGILALGMTFIIICGEIDLSVGAILCISGIVIVSLQKTGAPLFVPVLAGLGVGVIIGFINGMLVAKKHLPSFIVTLATMTAIRGFALLYTEGYPISCSDSTFIALGKAKFIGIPVYCYIFVIVAIVYHFLLSSTTFGRKTYAIGSNIESAKFSGINVDKVKIELFALMGFTAALSGLLYSARLASIAPTNGQLYEIDVIAMVVIGGVSIRGGSGTILQTIPGILIFASLTNILTLNNVNPFYYYLVKGLVIIIALILQGGIKWKFKDYRFLSLFKSNHVDNIDGRKGSNE